MARRRKKKWLGAKKHGGRAGKICWDVMSSSNQHAPLTYGGRRCYPVVSRRRMLEHIDDFHDDGNRQWVRACKYDRNGNPTGCVTINSAGRTVKRTGDGLRGLRRRRRRKRR